VVPDLEEELDRLYGLSLDEFTPARNDLARRLKRANQDEAAARVQALKKPSVPVWTANQLARRRPDEVAALVDAGLRLRQAQEQALSGGADRDAVRRATGEEREAARTLTRLAQELLQEQGRPATRAVIDRLGGLFRSAAITPEAGDALKAGRLTEEVEAGGFDALAGLAPARPARPKRQPKDEEAAERKRREQERKRLEAQVERRRRALQEAEAKAERAEQAAENARAAVSEAREALAEAEAGLQE